MAGSGTLQPSAAPAAAGARPARGAWRRLRPGGLHGRLLASVSAVVLATLAALAAHTAHRGGAQALDQARAQGAAIARSVALAGAAALRAGQPEALEPLLLGHAALPGVVSLQVLDARGRLVGQAQPDGTGRARLVLAPPQPLPVPPADGRASAGALDTPAHLVAWEPVPGGAPPAWVRVELRLAALHAPALDQAWRALAAGLVAALGSALALHRLLRGPRRALGEAQGFAAALAQADGRQLALDADGPHEIRALGLALNEASQGLAEQRQTLERTLAELARQRAELHDGHLQLTAVFALSPDGLLTLDAAGRVRHANPAFCRLTGLSADVVQGWSQAELEAQLRMLSADPADWAGLEPCFAAGTPGAPGTADGLRLALAAPQARTLALLGRQAAPAGEAARTPPGEARVTRLLCLRDVTREAELDRMKSDFLSTAAHELRTPLASIYGFAELLCHRSFEPVRQARMLEAIHRNSGVMAHILNDLLDLSRLEARRGSDFRRQPCDLGELVTRCLADQAPPPGREPPQLLATGGSLPVRVDAGKIRQVLANLLSNAYKYSPQGGPVRVRLLRDLDPTRLPRVGFEVADSGIGLTPQQQARVFERFYRADPSGTIQGTGLGMSIVREIVALHGGEVQLHSRAGQGTEVAVWLPLAA